MMIRVVIGKLPGLAPAAGSPRSAAAAAAATAATAPSAASASPASSATAAAAAAATTAATAHPCDLRAVLGCRGVFLVENVECRQADVSDFFHAKRQLMIGSKGWGRRHVRCRYRGCRCAANHCETQAGGSQHRGGFHHPLLGRSVFHPWHRRNLHTSNGLTPAQQLYARQMDRARRLQVLARTLIVAGIVFGSS